VALPASLPPAAATSIDISGPTGPQQQTYDSGFAALDPPMLGQTDRRTDTVLLHRPCFAYYAGSANDIALG